MCILFMGLFLPRPGLTAGHRLIVNLINRHCPSLPLCFTSPFLLLFLFEFWGWEMEQWGLACCQVKGSIWCVSSGAGMSWAAHPGNRTAKTMKRSLQKDTEWRNPHLISLQEGVSALQAEVHPASSFVLWQETLRRAETDRVGNLLIQGDYDKDSNVILRPFLL